MLQPVRDPVDRALIKAELTANTYVRTVRGIEVHITDARAAPNVMQEIGRIREVEFRKDGGGTGKTVDIDKYDTGSSPFRQIVAWDPDNQELIGMYRYVEATDVRSESGEYELPTARLFTFSEQFKEEFLPWTVELGRSVVNRSATRAIMGLFAAWAGLGALIRTHVHYRYFFGKFTMYPSYDSYARSLIQDFMRLYCSDPDRLLEPRPGLSVDVAPDYASPFRGNAYDEDYERMVSAVSDRGAALPPLVISYLGLSRTMRCFGTARNDHFGGVYECAILVRIADVGEKQRKRYVESFDGEPTWERV